MADWEIVDAQWTVHNQRRMAKDQLMLVTGVVEGEDKALLDSDYKIALPKEVSAGDPKTVSKGNCYCGKVQLELPRHLKPAVSVICHCHDCREWHSVGSLPYMMFPLDYVEGVGPQIPLRITAGSSLLLYVHRTPEVRRFYTKCCGTRLFNCVWNEAVGLKLCGTFPTVFPDYEWQPTMHVNVRETNYPTLDIEKWNDLPLAFGGTGSRPLE